MAQRQPTRQQMLDWVDMVSFAVQDVNLYLDTHPTDPEALAYFQEYSRLRNQALEDYASMYGPLTIDTARVCQQQWEWVNDPWPWEGGAC
jgi:spore coat protein JB